jgi:hypothetical protein
MKKWLTLSLIIIMGCVMDKYPLQPVKDIGLAISIDAVSLRKWNEIYLLTFTATNIGIEHIGCYIPIFKYQLVGEDKKQEIWFNCYHLSTGEVRTHEFPIQTQGVDIVSLEYYTSTLYGKDEVR